MSRKTSTTKSIGFRVLALIAALTWVVADVAVADQGRAGSSRSSSPSSGSSASSASPSSSGSSGSSGRTAVSRSPSGSRASAPNTGQVRSSSRTRRSGGAARTRTGQRPNVRRGGGGHHRSGGYYRGYYGLPYYWSPWGYWGWGLTFGHGYGAYGHGYGHYPPVVYSSRAGYRMGALDLKVRPKNTEIYVDGQYVGLARQYDGFPGHLWLEKGVYDVSFYRPGFETQTRTIKVMTDLILELEIQMESGVAVKPEMRFEPEDRQQMEQGSADEIGEWGRRPTRGDYQARLHLDVEPAQALVYLDGNILGTGDELAGLHAGLILSAGTHTLEIVHRGFETVERSIVVQPGEEIDFELTLQPSAGSASP